MVPVVSGQKTTLFSNSLTIPQPRLSSIPLRMANGPFALPFPKFLVPTKQGRRPRSSQPERMASGVEELRFRRAKRAGSKGLHSLFSLFLKPLHSKDRHRSADMVFFPKSRGFADPKTGKSAGHPSAVAVDRGKVRHTSTFICATASRRAKSGLVLAEFTDAKALGSALLVPRPRHVNAPKRFRKRLRLLSGVAECLRWLC